MKAVLLTASFVLAAALVLLGRTFTAENIPVEADFAIAIPPASPPPEFSVSVMHAGRMHSKAAFAYRGGAFGDERIFGMAGVLLRHPRGMLLVDAGFGRNVDTHVLTTPFLMRALSAYDKEPTVVDQLRAAGIDPKELQAVVITHAHWDHVSGIEDLPGVPVWVTQPERDFIRLCNEQTALMCSFGELPYRIYEFPSGPYLGFESSYDVFGDGSVVIVPVPGHTPGSVTVFATLASGQRYAFIGDTAWQKEGVDLPAERPWLPRNLLKEDAAQVRRWLVHLHRLQEAVPDLTIVPAHDRRVLETLPTVQPANRNLP